MLYAMCIPKLTSDPVGNVYEMEELVGHNVYIFKPVSSYTLYTQGIYNKQRTTFYFWSQLNVFITYLEVVL